MPFQASRPTCNTVLMARRRKGERAVATATSTDSLDRDFLTLSSKSQLPKCQLVPWAPLQSKERKRHLQKAIHLILKQISKTGSMNHYLISFLSYGYEGNVTSNF